MAHKNTHSKIPDKILLECFELYIHKGWKLLWIARKFNIYHTSLFYHITKRGIRRKAPVLLKKPTEVEELYRLRQQSTSRHKRRVFESADENNDDVSDKKNSSSSTEEVSLRKEDTLDNECSHIFWIKRCSTCSAILESDSQLNQEASLEPTRFCYHEFDKIVCSHEVALELQHLRVFQNSMLYWIYYDNKNFLTLRVKANLPTLSDENAIAVSAFTSQELFQLLLRLPAYMRDASFMNKLALNGGNPIYLAKLLIRSLRLFEKERNMKRKAIQDTITKPTVSIAHSNI